MQTLEIEARTYRDRLGEIVKLHAGEYMVIHGTQAVHFSPSYETALVWGYETYGLDEPFFVKQVAQDQQVAHFTRDPGSCRS